VFRLKLWEDDGDFYQRILKVKKWKNSLPELGDFCKSIFHKKRIKTFDPTYLEVYVTESCRAELAHESIIASSLLFPLWAAPSMFLTIFNIALFLNVPFIIIQRYNRPRILRMLARKKRLFTEIKAEDITVS
jgi:glycosyl-4,4'-diaponeurosporenoate acyltransferase